MCFHAAMNNDSSSWTIDALINRRNFMKATGGAGGLAMTNQFARGGTNGDGEGREGTANSSPTFIPLGYRVPGALYDPSKNTESDDKDQVGFVIIHPNFSVLTADQTDFTDVNIGAEFAQRGYRALVADTEELPGTYHIHDLLPEVGAAVSHLQDYPKIETTVLVGYSRGAHLMAFYQNVAENGTQVAQSDDLLFPAPDDIEEQPAADGVLILDGVLGTGPGGGGPPEGLLEVDPRIANNDPQARLSSLDIYASENGFAPGGESSYSDEFLADVFQAQADRMDELVAVAETKQEQVDSGSSDFPDQEPLIAVGLNTPVADLDSDLLARTSEEWPVITADGSASVEKVPYIGPAADADPDITYADETLTTTAGRFLSTNSIRTTDEYKITKNSIEGLDYSSTNAEAPGNLEGVAAPLLIVSFTGTRNYIVHNEIMMEHAGSSEKSLMYVEGASHGLEPIADEYGDTVSLTFDTIDRWAVEQFM